MKTGIVVTTYNWPEALSCVLASIARQHRLPDEVIVADDGSDGRTRELLMTVAESYPVPLKHCWQQDRGFRAARVRNLAYAASGCDYLLQIDGDMILEPHFVRDHLQAARPGCFVQGSRVLTTAEGSQELLSGRTSALGFFDGGIARRRNSLRSLALSWLYLSLAGTGSPRSIKSCNQGWWRADLLALNGYDERFVGWGREDSDLARRALRLGIGCRNLRYAGLAYHLYHRERHEDGESANQPLFEENNARGATRIEHGIDQHLLPLRRHPLPDLRLCDPAHAIDTASWPPAARTPDPEHIWPKAS